MLFQSSVSFADSTNVLIMMFVYILFNFDHMW